MFVNSQAGESGSFLLSMVSGSQGVQSTLKERRALLMSKIICRPERVGKPGPKTVVVPRHVRSTPKPIKKKC